MGVLRNRSELRSLQEAGRITREVLAALTAACIPGVSTVELEALANQLLARNRSTAPFKSFDGFNHAICISINEEIVNGPPSRERRLQTGDVVSIATAAEHRGIHAKAARTVCVGETCSDAIMRLLTGTTQVIDRALEKSREQMSNATNNPPTLNELLAVVPETAQAHGLTMLRGLGGMGIGKKLHEAPLVPNNPADLPGTVMLEVGLTFTLMPMFSLGADDEFDTHEDGWTYVTRDKSMAAHVADTLLMTETGLILITG